MRVLVIGSGGREHALVLALSRDPAVTHLMAAPGNPGIAALAELHDLPSADPDAVAALAAATATDLVVVGPEAPLVAGAADAVRARGIACFGPSAAAARLEGSKAFAKEVMAAAGVPTAMSFVCETPDEVAHALDAFGPTYVVKDDALAAGKGVVVTDDRDEALAHGSSCARVVVEEFLDGPEVSVFAICDGDDAVALLPSQDFKRLGDGDAGPNTGGMGAYAPLPWADAGLVDDTLERVVRPTLAEMRSRGTPFQGLLYVGLALTSRGMRVVEFNARFGDPETQVVLPLLRTPLAGLLLAAATGRLDDHEPLRWSSRSGVAVVLASEGYPAAPVTGRVITGAGPSDGDTDDAYVLHAGTGLADGTRVETGTSAEAGTNVEAGTSAEAGTNVDAGALVTAGGRVLNVVGLGDDLAAARAAAYERLDRVGFDGAQLRRDIARAASD